MQVSPSLNIFSTLSYNYRGDPAILKPGVRVVVPVGNRLTTGWIIETSSHYQGRVKDIIAVVRDDYAPGSQFMAFVRAVSHLYFASMGSLLDYSLPPKKKPITGLYFENRENQEKVEKLIATHKPEPALTSDQEKEIDEILKKARSFYKQKGLIT